MRTGFTDAQTWDPVSGITVKRTVSSSRRNQAIFSRDERAATSSVELRVSYRRGDLEGRTHALENVRIFLRFALNLMFGCLIPN